MSTLQVNQVDCANCGAKIDIRTGIRVKTFTCEYCGAVCENDQVVAIQNQQEIKERFAPQSFLKLGLQGTFLNSQYQIVGRIRLEGKEGEETWFWDEWFLMSATGFPLWLIEDEHGYSLMRRHLPTEFIDPYAATGEYVVDGSLYRIKERGMATLSFLEGELTWRARPNEVVNYVDLEQGDNLFSMEYTQTEIQYTKGKKVKRETLIEAFQVSPPDDLPKESPKPQKKPKRKFHYVLWALLIALIGGAAFFFSIYAESFGTRVFRVAPQIRLRRNTPVTLEFKGLDGNRRTFKISKGPIVGFKFRSNSFGGGRSDLGFWASATLYQVVEGGQDKEIGTMDVDFWFATWVEDGELSSEHKYRDVVYVDDLEIGKEYYLVVETDVNPSSSRSSLGATLQIEVVDGAWDPVPIRRFSYGVLIFSVLFLAFCWFMVSDD